MSYLTTWGLLQVFNTMENLLKSKDSEGPLGRWGPEERVLITCWAHIWKPICSFDFVWLVHDLKMLKERKNLSTNPIWITGKIVMQLVTFLAKFPWWEKKKLKFWCLIVRNFEMQKNYNTFTVGVLEIIHGWWNKWWSSTQPVFPPLQRKTPTKVEILETFIASS